MVVAILIDERTAVGFDDQLAERQTDAAAADLRGFAEFEDFGALFGRHARSAIADIYEQFVSIFIGAHLNVAAVRLRFHGISQQVVKGLAQTRWVSLNRPRPKRQFRAKAYFLRSASRAQR